MTEKDERKKALLVVNYGTAVKEAYEKSVEKIEDELKVEFPDRAFYRAWTSAFVIKKAKEKYGMDIDNVGQAIYRMIKDGIKDVIVQPTHLIYGVECEKICKAFEEAGQAFERIRIGRPLLDNARDLEDAAGIISEAFPDVISGKKALLLMGHGSPKGDGEIYRSVETAFGDIGHGNVFVGAMSGEPEFGEACEKLKAWCDERKKKGVILAPLLLVAGSHALKDMIGDDPHTWESMLGSEGFDVETVPKGLGEYPGIRKMYVDHASDAEAM